ncbi:MAG: hypothetical protein DKM50_03390 [Candidatus Margulisiibacteriota bacterium]|nr:MAG: hypothetical protein A2X43_09530 [Candidatus Margulisbacteria bacterium GWD2_39_127]OGI02870.1 MAG: hypothetical protein A2X42_02235 [Candidatus Margulisbacteria bacterium GWF2_38_17]OGI09651.1 MAG: hypothetical protein A2X41_04945 [Candidatus Margulisbacteria bacterium GWE2_39_32]PZM83023.1 MAG: hypothetical protein DKM50_03390 [Candidatus Margulisiibacteriota bacterium]HAR62183.1 hypothetical protein [Candidatus Margulisiibacteriota bacterium]
MAKVLGFIPLDDRPVSLQQSVMLAQMAGYEVMLPPIQLLGHRMISGNPDAILKWFFENVSSVDGWVISLDMLAYGGLVASREITEDLALILLRLQRLALIKIAYPTIPLYAFQSIRRLSTTVKSSDDLEKWEISHRTGVLSDLRTRNHKVNLYSLEQLSKKIFDFVLLLQEDANLDGPHQEEHKILQEYIKEKGISQNTCITTGTDEGSAVLMSRLMCDLSKIKPKVYVLFSSENGSRRVALYEDRCICDTVRGQIRAIGCDTCLDLESADFVLAVWCPDHPGIDLMFSKPFMPNEQDISVFLDKINILIEEKYPLVIADLAYSNGSDKDFCDKLSTHIEISGLAGYAAWNTAANSVGHALAQGVLSLNNKRFLALRFLEDWGYQSEIRPVLNEVLKTNGYDIWNLTPEQVNSAEDFLNKAMREWQRKKLGNQFGAELSNIRFNLPWQRTFEVEVTI